MLRELSSDLFVTERPFRFLGLGIGVRMTVFRMPSGLWVHSPVRLDEETQRDLDTLGPVRVVVAPNLMHHLFVRGYFSSYPEAKIYAAPGLEKKRANVPFHGILGDAPLEGLAGEVEQLVFPSLPMLGREVVFFLRRPRTLVCTDLLFHLQEANTLWEKAALGVLGGYRKLQPTLEMRAAMRFKAKECRRAVEAILSWDFDRIIMAHGEIIEHGGKEAFRAAFQFLLPS